MKLKRYINRAGINAEWGDKNASARAQECVYNLTGLLFSHSITSAELLEVLHDLNKFISVNQLLFYYRVVPVIVMNNTFETNVIVRNIYMLRLIKKALDKNTITMYGSSRIIRQYKKKFNLL